MPSDLPIATPTVARVYMIQGKLKQAEAIFRALLTERPDDAALAQGLSEVQARLAAEATPTEDRVTLVRPPRGEGLVCRYQVTVAGRKRAQLVLGNAGRLCLQVLAYPVADSEAVRTLPAADDGGEVGFEVPAGARTVAAAIGLESPEGRFAAIAHSGATAIDELDALESGSQRTRHPGGRT